MASLYSKGLDKILKKVGEESAETIIAAKDGKKEEIVNKRVSEAVQKVKKSKRRYILDRMPANERRMAYIALKREKGISFETVVEGDYKKIVIFPSSSGR